ncbi:MAG: flagellar assembly protein FliW [Thermodesulfobacteriota bacterium]
MTILQTEVNKDKIVTFPDGIPGFEEYTTFRLFHKEDNGHCAYWLESCKSPTVTFTLVDPGRYDLNYELILDDMDQETIKADCVDDLGIFIMLVKPEDQEHGLRANINGPLIINISEQLGMQKVVKSIRESGSNPDH